MTLSKEKARLNLSGKSQGSLLGISATIGSGNYLYPYMHDLGHQNLAYKNEFVFGRAALTFDAMLTI